MSETQAPASSPRQVRPGHGRNFDGFWSDRNRLCRAGANEGGFGRTAKCAAARAASQAGTTQVRATRRRAGRCREPRPQPPHRQGVRQRGGRRQIAMKCELLDDGRAVTVTTKPEPQRGDRVRQLLLLHNNPGRLHHWARRIALPGRPLSAIVLSGPCTKTHSSKSDHRRARRKRLVRDLADGTLQPITPAGTITVFDERLALMADDIAVCSGGNLWVAGGGGATSGPRRTVTNLPATPPRSSPGPDGTCKSRILAWASETWTQRRARRCPLEADGGETHWPVL